MPGEIGCPDRPGASYLCNRPFALTLALSRGEREPELWLPSPLGRRVGDEGDRGFCKTEMLPERPLLTAAAARR
jgi:hypothetical protein